MIHEPEIKLIGDDSPYYPSFQWCPSEAVQIYPDECWILVFISGNKSPAVQQQYALHAAGHWWNTARKNARKRQGEQRQHSKTQQLCRNWSPSKVTFKIKHRQWSRAVPRGIFLRLELNSINVPGKFVVGVLSERKLGWWSWLDSPGYNLDTIRNHGGSPWFP